MGSVGDTIDVWGWEEQDPQLLTILSQCPVAASAFPEALCGVVGMSPFLQGILGSAGSLRTIEMHGTRKIFRSPVFCQGLAGRSQICEHQSKG